MLLYFTHLAALVPDPVHNLKINVDQNVPSVALFWHPPQNVGGETQRSPSYVSRYHIRFKPKDRQHYDEMVVDSSTTSIILNRDSGLIPLTTSTFKVRAQCGVDLGEWNAISSYVGKYSWPDNTNCGLGWLHSKVAKGHTSSVLLFLQFRFQYLVSIATLFSPSFCSRTSSEPKIILGH